MGTHKTLIESIIWTFLNTPPHVLLPSSQIHLYDDNKIRCMQYCLWMFYNDWTCERLVCDLIFYVQFLYFLFVFDFFGNNRQNSEWKRLPDEQLMNYILMPKIYVHIFKNIVHAKYLSHSNENRWYFSFLQSNIIWMDYQSEFYVSEAKLFILIWSD